MSAERNDLEIDDVSVAFGGVQAIDHLSLAIRAKELVGIIGPNGAGKTTLFKVVVGVIRPRLGRVVFRGRDITNLGMHERAQGGIGLAHQIVRPFRNMTPIENVALAAGSPVTRRSLRSLFRLDRRMALSRALELLDLVGMADLAWKDVNSLPLGFLKRLEVARALALAPGVVLLDEPLAGLNQGEAERLASTIERINASGVTVVLIEHNLREVVRIAQRVIVLDGGRLLAQGHPHSIMNQASVRNAYMGTEADLRHAAA
jgi:branched-chain amino acid transport system ATP-binding protein